MRQHSSKQMYTKLLIRHNKSKTLAHIYQLPSRQPTMAWVLARHGFDDISGAHVINPHIEMTVHYNNGHTLFKPFNTTVTFPFSTHRSLGRLEKKSLTMRQHSSKQLHTGCCYLHHNESKTLALYRVCPPRFISRKQGDQDNLYGAALEHLPSFL